MDQFFGTIRQLPAVLQNEIWEYVRGDRAFWKQQFEQCLAIFRPTPEPLFESISIQCGGVYHTISGDLQWILDEFDRLDKLKLKPVTKNHDRNSEKA